MIFLIPDFNSGVRIRFRTYYIPVRFFTDPSGFSPITDFLDHCPISLRVKILRQVQYLTEFGLSPSIPSLKKLTGTNLWELRILGKNNLRLLCCHRHQSIYIVHLFFKKSQKTPLKEISLALKRAQSLDL